MSSGPGRRQQRAIAGHPVFAALNRGPLTADEQQQLAAMMLLPLQALAQGSATVAECRDLHDLVAIGVELARTGIGSELLPVAEPVLRDVRATLAGPDPAQAMVAHLPGLMALQTLLDEQRRLVSRCEWIRTMQMVAGTAPLPRQPVS